MDAKGGLKREGRTTTGEERKEESSVALPSILLLALGVPKYTYKAGGIWQRQGAQRVEFTERRRRRPRRRACGPTPSRSGPCRSLAVGGGWWVMMIAVSAKVLNRLHVRKSRSLRSFRKFIFKQD